jgi:phospholipid/cholesterol/gamma-HCH transport system substrate-binding protein
MFVIFALGIFTYMLFHLGVFRLNVRKFKPYRTTFCDVSGLTEKADVKIAGVKIGWVDSIELRNDGAFVGLMINNKCCMRQDAYAVIRQDGLLGARYVDLVSGSPNQPILSPGSTLQQPGESVVSVESLMGQLKQITGNVLQVTDSLNKAFGAREQSGKIESFVENLTKASERIAQIADVLDRAVSSNDKNINDLVCNVCCLSNDIKEVVPEIRQNLARLGDRLDGDIFPAFQESIEKIAHVFDRDFGTVARKLESTANSIESLVADARERVQDVGDISSKIKRGEGVLGKLISDDSVYCDIQHVTTSFRQSIQKFDDMKVVVDARGESMTQPVDCYKYCNNYGYIDVLFYTTPQWFYGLSIVTSERGWPERSRTQECYFNKDYQLVDPDAIVLDTGNIKVTPNIEKTRLKRNAARIDLRVGKMFGNGFTLRGGSFENTFGFALDYALPMRSDIIQWITSLEAYDFYGRNRLKWDRRPHLKWCNRVYLFNNIYFTFGVDDFVSKYNKNGYWGFGLRFSDDDLKHVATKFGTFGAR